MICSISGPSCAGKTTLLRGLQERIWKLEPLESVTTRQKRPSDTDPREYMFVSDAEFDQLNAAGVFLWTAQPYGTDRYATRTKAVHSALCSDKIFVPILTIEATGILLAFAARTGLAERVIPLYLYITNTEELRRRFTERGDSNPADVERRIAEVKKETRAFIKQGHKMYIIDATLPKEAVIDRACRYIAPLAERETLSS